MISWLSAASLAIAVLSVALAVIFYVKGKKAKRPCYAMRSINLVRDLVGKVEALEMFYSGQRIENLTVTKIAFWNGGRETIYRQDIASAEPLIIQAKEGCKILDAKIIYEKNPANQFSINICGSQSTVELQFDYLDKDEGVIIQVIHTGKSSKDIEITGIIKGAGRPVYKHVPTLSLPLPGFSQLSVKKRRYLVATIAFILPLTVAIDLFVSPISLSQLVLSIIIVATYWSLGFYLLKRRLPKGFDIFVEEEL